MSTWNSDLDFEDQEEFNMPGAFEEVELGKLFDGSILKKVAKGFVALHSKPTGMILGAVGGKKGKALGEKIGKYAAYGAGAGLAAAAAPVILSSPTAITALTGAAIARRAQGKGVFTKKPLISSNIIKRVLDPSGMILRQSRTLPPSGGEIQSGRVRIRMRDTSSSSSSGGGGGASNAATMKLGQDALIRGIMGKIAAQLMPAIQTANKSLRYADNQRQATYEHDKIVTTDKFRRTVLKELARRARAGDQTCGRTVRVIMSRGGY